MYFKGFEVRFDVFAFLFVVDLVTFGVEEDFELKC